MQNAHLSESLGGRQDHHPGTVGQYPLSDHTLHGSSKRRTLSSPDDPHQRLVPGLLQLPRRGRPLSVLVVAWRPAWQVLRLGMLQLGDIDQRVRLDPAQPAPHGWSIQVGACSSVSIGGEVFATG
jgi:hypothetical protein